MVQVYKFPENLAIEEQENSIWQELYQAYQNNMIITALISGIEEYNFKGKKGVALVVMFDGGVKGLIPHFESSIPGMDNLVKTLKKDNGYFPAIKKRLKSLIGNVEPVKIKEIYQENNLVYLSRKDAMTHLAELTWKKFETGKLTEGNIVAGKVRGVTDKSVTVDIEGIIAYMAIKHLSWGYVENPYQVVEVGEIINLRVKEVDVNNRKLLVSHRACVTNPWPDCTDRYLVGNHYMGKISNIHDKGVFVNLEPGVDLFAKHPKFLKPSKGDQVIVKIFGLDKKKKWLWGRVFDKA